MTPGLAMTTTRRPLKRLVGTHTPGEGKAEVLDRPARLINQGSHTMNPSQMPTDNLYKFMAVSGLASALAMTVLLVVTLHRTQIQVDAAEAEQRITDGSIQYMDDLLNEAKERDQRVDDAITRGEAKEAREHLNEKEVIHAETLKLQPQLRERIERSWVAIASNKSLLSHLLLLQGFFHALIPLSLAFSGIGFLLWYYRLQRYQDAILRKSATADHED